MKILLIEDDEAVRDTLLDILSFKQHAVQGVTSAEEALTSLAGGYDVIIADVFLQGMDGTALLDTLKDMNLQTPVVMITGFSDVEIEEACRKKGAAGFLKKPFTVDSLLAVLNTVVQR